MTRVVPVALVLALLPAPALAGPISYGLRNAHFFGGTPGPTREINTSGSLTPSTNVNAPFTFSTGGPDPVVFSGTPGLQGAPLEFRVANSVAAGSSVALESNLSPFGPLNFVSLVQSRVSESGLLATGGVGTGYLLPTFRFEGHLSDAHATAFGSLSACAGIAACTATGVASSSGGTQVVDALFTPGIGDTTTKFTFDVPFDFFFFASAGVSSFANTLAPGGVVSADARVRLVGYRLVDANGNDIDGATLDSDLLNPVPEPTSVGLTATGVVALLARWRRRMRNAAR